jgi:hypothetical protein
MVYFTARYIYSIFLCSFDVFPVLVHCIKNNLATLVCTQVGVNVAFHLEAKTLRLPLYLTHWLKLESVRPSLSHRSILGSNVHT